MIEYIYLPFRFLMCLFLSEVQIFRTRINYLNFFFLNINLLKYLFYLYDKDINPFKSNKFLEFIKFNKKKWIKFNNNKKINTSGETILVENFLNHPAYKVENILIGKYLQFFNKSKCISLLRNGDIKGEVLSRSFGIDKFHYYKFGGFYQRCKYIFKSIVILRKVKNIKKFCDITLRKVNIGLTSYDSFIRYTRNPTSKKINVKLILFFAEAIYAIDFFERIFQNSNITKLVQGEQHFVPLSILFQTGLLKKNKIYTRFGTVKKSVRIYTHFNQRYMAKNEFSKKLFEEIFKYYKTKSIKLVNKWYKKLRKSNFYGQVWGQHVYFTKNTFSLWKAAIGLGTFNPDNIVEDNINNNTLLNFHNSNKSKAAKISNKNFKSFSKSDLCKMFNWDKKKKIVTIFLHILIDGNCKYGKRNLFLDNYTWITSTLETIKKIKNVNFIIKQHPWEDYYNAKINIYFLVKELEKKYEHIRLSPLNLQPSSLIKFTDVAITSHGSVGAEYPAFGIPCIVAENSNYTNLGFTIKPKNKDKYVKLLQKIHKINKLNKRKIQKAKVFLFIHNILTKSKSSFMPELQPNFLTRTVDENKFWLQSNKKLKKFNPDKDQFKKMFEKQLSLKHRHTINFDICSIKNKILNDY